MFEQNKKKSGNLLKAPRIGSSDLEMLLKNMKYC